MQKDEQVDNIRRIKDVRRNNSVSLALKRFSCEN